MGEIIPPRNEMDKSQKYILEWSEEFGYWCCYSEDLQQYGYAFDTELKPEDRDAAPGLAVLNMVGYDSDLIADILGFLKGREVKPNESKKNFS